MRLLEYAFLRGATGLWRRRGSSAFAIVAIALAVVVLGALLLVTWNAERVLARWSAGSEFSVYLRDDATSEQRGVVERVLDQSAITSGREFVSKQEALARFRAEFADLASLTRSFDNSPFPASLEVRLSPLAERDGRADALFRRVATLPGVSDVRFDRDWLARVGAGLNALRAVGLGLASLMALAAAVTVASVVRLSFDAQREELEIMQLVGAPLSFIRGPFIAEGVLQGGLGALAALAVLWGAFLVADATWGNQVSQALEGLRPEFLPWRVAASLLAGGLLLGGVGGAIASRHVD